MATHKYESLNTPPFKAQKHPQNLSSSSNMMQPEEGNPPDVALDVAAHDDDDAHVLTHVGGHAVTLFNDEHFAKCRAMLGVNADVLTGFEFRELAGGGGKGGDVMAFTADRKYIVKGVGGNDQDALLRHAEALCARMASNETLMSKMLWHFEIADGDHAGCYFVMNNCLPVLPKSFEWSNTFDLKGCCDDKVLYEEGERVEEVHKRCFSLGQCWYGCDLPCCICNTPERMRYYQGKKFALSVKFPVAAKDKEYIDRIIGADCDFFSNDIVTMDYSLILGVVTCRKGEEDQLPPGAFPNQPFLAYTGGDEVNAYYFGIIDFLQEWTATKKVCILELELGPFVLCSLCMCALELKLGQAARHQNGALVVLGLSSCWLVVVVSCRSRLASNAASRRSRYLRSLPTGMLCSLVSTLEKSLSPRRCVGSSTPRSLLLQLLICVEPAHFTGHTTHNCGHVAPKL